MAQLKKVEVLKFLTMAEYKERFRNLPQQRMRQLECRLQELITDREGMIAENQQRVAAGHNLAYSESSFSRLSEEIKGLINVVRSL